MIENWNEKTTLGKAMDIISGVALCVWFIFEWMANKMQYAEIISCAAICIVCVCEAISFWKTKRVFSYIAIGGLALLLTVLVLTILLAV